MLEGFARAEAMFGVEPVPEAERFAKYAGMRKAARAADRSVQLPPVTIMHRSGKNPAGLFQNACEYCGDCYSGCNAGAKITVGQTYIADAAHHGAEVFSGSRAESISQADRGWQILVKDQTGAGGSRQVEADILVLAAGTMGTTELLLRAKKRGLALSEMLGEKFSANGDDMVLAAELDEPVNAVATGYPTLAPPETPKVGTHSMAMIDLGDEDGHMCLYDGTMINMMAAMAPLNAIMEFRLRRAVKLLKDGIYGDALSRTQLYYIVGQDDASGRLRLQGDSLFVDWPDYNTSTARVAAEEKVKTLIEQMGGVFKKNPFESRAFGGNRVIAHPLGGCAMAETVDDGVVAPDGRVFDLSNGPNGVHEGLYVCDGAFIPSSLGVSPLLTISALAERTMMLAAERLGRNLDVSSPPRRAQRNATM